VGSPYTEKTNVRPGILGGVGQHKTRGEFLNEKRKKKRRPGNMGNEKFSARSDLRTLRGDP